MKDFKKDFQKHQTSSLEFNEKFDPKWISEKFTREADMFAEKFGKYLYENELSTSQLRNIFVELKNIQMRLLKSKYEEEESRIVLIKAKMAYAEARVDNKKKTVYSKFKEYFNQAHKEIKDKQSFNRFVDFITAVLAYHKAAGGK